MAGDIDLSLMVDEAIRWTSPVKHFMRHATEDYEIRNTKIKKGDALMLLYPSGNRDDEVFEKPFEFIADRRPNRHLAFGHGAHHCLGNILAKLEMKFLYQKLFAKVKKIELNGTPKNDGVKFCYRPKEFACQDKGQVTTHFDKEAQRPLETLSAKLLMLPIVSKNMSGASLRNFISAT